MDPSKYITPRLGIRTIVAVIVWIVVIWVASGSENWGAGSIPEIAVQTALFGSIYGMASWACWLCTAFPAAPLRFSARIVAMLLASSILNIALLGDHWLKCLISLGGLMISQSMVFFLVGIPAWQVGSLARTGSSGSGSSGSGSSGRGSSDMGSSRRGSSQSGNRQFSISEILVGTTGVALLLGLAIEYRTEVNAKTFWLVLAGIWILLPVTSVVGCIAALSRSAGTRSISVAGALFLTLSGAIGLGYFEAQITQSTEWIRLYALLYGVIASGHVMMIAALALAGRHDWENHPSRRKIEHNG